jgi:ribosomal protein S12 methylthiotransferase accessory factor
VYANFGEVIIGPILHRKKQLCFHCADRRIIMGGKDRPEMSALYQMKKQSKQIHADPWINTFAVEHVQHMIVHEIKTVLSSASSLQNELIITHLPTLQTSRHKLLADPLCPICGNLPEDSPELADITIQTSLKSTDHAFRVLPFSKLSKTIKADYYDDRTGVLNQKIHDPVSPFATASVKLPLYTGDEATAGRTHRFQDSENTAILEGLERSCGIAPRGKKTIIHDSYRHVANDALHPEQVGTHSKEQYAMPHFPFRAFDADQKINWVWGYSFRQNRPILVPERLAYYSLGNDNGYVYETSNGCALGGSLEEAIFHGILEVMERDAFLLTWYAKLPLTKIDPASADDLELALMLHRIEEVAGYDIHLFDATMEYQIPSIWALAKNKKEAGFHIICAAASHLDPIKAAKNALHELAGMMLTLDNRAKHQRDKYRKMINQPHLVRQMPDHSMLYSIPETEHRFHFLLEQNKQPKTFQQLPNPPISKHNVTEDLLYLIQTCHRIDLDVIVVNQTTTELEHNKLHCVKVIIPGMLPMTFGHYLTRLTGLPRVLTVPKLLGYRNDHLTLEQVNPHPHPFP